LSDSFTTLCGFLAILAVPASMVASKVISRAQQRGKWRDLPLFQPTPWVIKSADRIRQRAKAEDPSMLSFVRGLTQNRRFFRPMKTKLLALTQEFGDEPDVADIVETLSYGTSTKDIYAAIEKLQTYLEAKSSESNSPS